MQLQSMYQDIILDHYRNPHHKGLRDPSMSKCITSTRSAATR